MEIRDSLWLVAMFYMFKVFQVAWDERVCLCDILVFYINEQYWDKLSFDNL